MTPEEFIAIRLEEGQYVRLKLRVPGGKPRPVRLFFRGYGCKDGHAKAKPVNELVPLFSPPTRRGTMSRNYYKALDTSFENILELEIL